MQVTEKGQVTIPKHIRLAAGVSPGSQVAFSLEAGKIVIRKVASGVKTDRRAQLRAAAARVRNSMKAPFRQMSADEIMAFLRDDPREDPTEDARGEYAPEDAREDGRQDGAAKA